MSDVNLDQATSINYSPKTYNDIYKKFLLNAYTSRILSNAKDALDYLNNGKDTENTMVLIFSNHANVLEGIYVDMTRIYNAQAIDTATGEDLDKVGTIFFPRRSADYSITEVILSCDAPLTETLTIPTGTVITNKDDTSITFKTIQDAYILTGESSVTVAVKATVLGPSGDVDAGWLNCIIGSFAKITSVLNLYKSSGGVYTESDDNYKDRLHNWKYILAKGTYDAIVNAIGDVSAVVQYHIDRLWDGAGTTKIVVDPPLNTVVSLVETSLENAEAVDEDINVVPVETVKLNLTCQANISLDQTVPLDAVATQRVALKVQGAIQTYINGGKNLDSTEQPELGIGKDFIPFKCAVYTANQVSELQTLEFTNPTTSVSISSNQKAIAGDIVVTVV